MTIDLPEGWTSVKLHNVIESALGGDWGKAPEERADGMVRVRVVRGTDFRSWNEEKGTRAAERYIKPSSLEKRRLRKGDLVLEVSGGGPNQPVGRTLLIDDQALKRADAPLVCSNFFRLLRLHQEIDPQFVAYFLDYAYALGAFNGFQTETTNLRNLNVPDFLEQTDIFLAPLAEQRRIVAQLQELFERVRNCQHRLERVPSLLRRFRQSVLSAACSGELTAKWRERNNVDSEWSDRRLSEMGSVSGGVTKNPKRAALKLQVPYLRVANVYENELRLDEISTIGVTEQEFNRTLLQAGDILFVEGNGSLDQIGRVALWDGSIPRCVHQNHLIKFRSGPHVLPTYVLIRMMAPDGREQLKEKAISSAGLNSLSISKISDIHLQVPSRNEQQEIVRRVWELFALSDQIEARLELARAHTQRLTASLLARAFRGELLPTEAEIAKAEGRVFESARILLSRVRGKENKSRLKKSGRQMGGALSARASSV